MSDQGATGNTNQTPTHRHSVHSQQESTENQTSATKQRPARYRMRHHPSLSSQSPHNLPRSPTSGGFENYAQSMTGGLISSSLHGQFPQYLGNGPYSTGFVASQVNIFNNNNNSNVDPRGVNQSYAAPAGFYPVPENRSTGRPVAYSWRNNPNVGLPSTPAQPTQLQSSSGSARPSVPSQYPSYQHAQGRANGLGYHGNDRTTVPSQLPPTPPISFHNHPNTPGARMINVPTPQNYLTADSLARRPPTSANRLASMPLAGFGMPVRNSVSENKSKPVQSNSTPNFSAGVNPLYGHRRNKTTISQFSDVVPRNTAHKGATHGVKAVRAVGGQFDAKAMGRERAALPAFSFGSGSAKLDAHIAISNGSASSSKENLLSFPSRAHERSTSNDSSSTVASDSWNVMDTATTLPKKEVGLKFDLETGHATTVSALPPTQHHNPDRKAPFDLKPGLPSQPSALSAIGGYHGSAALIAEFNSRVRKRYPLDECVQASHEHSIQTYDFAYANGMLGGKKHVRFASHSDHAPSMHYPSSSEDSTASTRESVDLGEYEGVTDGSRSVANGAVAREKDEKVRRPATIYNVSPVTYRNDPTRSDDDTSLLNSSTTPRKLSKLPSQPQQHKKHKHSASLNLLRRASASIHKFAAAHAGMAPVRARNNDDGLLDRGFQFPAHNSDQRVSSMPNLRVTGGEKDNGHTRRSSFGRFLEGFGGKRSV